MGRRRHGCVEPARPRQPLQLPIEDAQEHQADVENGHRAADQRQPACAAVDPGVAMERRDDPQRRADQNRDEHGRQRQFDGRRQIVAKIGDHGAACANRLAQVALQEAAEHRLTYWMTAG